MGRGSGAKPRLVIGEVTSFPSESDIPVIAKVESAELHAFKAAGVAFSEKHPTYAPHVTLSYSPAGSDVPDQVIEPLTWTATHLEMWCGGHDDSG